MSMGRPESAAERTFRPAPTPSGPIHTASAPAESALAPSSAGRQSVTDTGGDREPGSGGAKLGPAIVHASVPFAGPVGPLIGLVMTRHKPGTAQHGHARESAVEALNFSIGYSAAVLISSILTVILVGAVMLPLVLLAALVLCGVGAIETYRGGLYRYPVNLRLVR